MGAIVIIAVAAGCWISGRNLAGRRRRRQRRLDLAGCGPGRCRGCRGRLCDKPGGSSQLWWPRAGGWWWREVRARRACPCAPRRCTTQPPAAGQRSRRWPLRGSPTRRRCSRMGGSGCSGRTPGPQPAARTDPPSLSRLLLPSAAPCRGTGAEPTRSADCEALELGGGEGSPRWTSLPPMRHGRAHGSGQQHTHTHTHSCMHSCCSRRCACPRASSTRIRRDGSSHLGL